MCGIAGFIASDGKSAHKSALAALEQALQHRGPDGRGEFVSADVSLLQTRLAIIDLETGDQPLYGPQKTVLVANGEIYNYLELKAARPDAPLKTRSDCELPHFTHAESGAAFSDELRGMYAIALHEATSGETFLARDPFGIKPLYYSEGEGGVAFASEPGALIAAGLASRETRSEATQELLQLQFTSGRSTIFRDVSRVLPGETLMLKGGKIAASRITPALPEGGPLAIAEDEALKKLDAVLMDSVNVHQRSDVPYGMFLSGGVDSSALLAAMARLNARPVIAFTAGFPDTRARDEREHARKVAKAAGAEHIEVAVTEKDFWDHLPKIVSAMDDPAADYAIVPTWILAREAAKGLKVVLSGEGGDEIFAGYGRYRTATRPWLLGGRPMRARGVFDGLGILRDETRHWREGILAAEKRSAKPGWSKLQRVQAADMGEWLPNDLLLKLDRCLMANGLEGRTPFLDRVVADFAFRLPDTLKIANGGGKYLLRRWLEQKLPEAEPFSKKRGFTVPVAEWIATRGARLASLVALNPGIAALCRPEAVEALFNSLGAKPDKRAGAAAWNLLFYALWHRIHAEGRKPEGDVLDFLERTA
jgi:asparagine synthase (glutamine-hydrolysing)